MAELELQVGDDRDEVGVAAALAVAVHRALDQHGALGDRGERVRDAALGVVVAVDAERRAAARPRRRRATASAICVRQRGAVGVAQRHALGARLGGGAQARERVGRVVAPAVEEVLGVVDHALALGDEEGDRVGDHRAGSRRASTRDDLLEVQAPGLADERADRREALGQHAQRRVLVRARRRAGGSCRTRRSRSAASSCASSANSSASLGLEAGKPASTNGDAELVEHVRDAQLLLDRERHALALHPVAQGGVVDRERGHGAGAACGHDVEPVGVAVRAAVQRVLERRLDRPRDRPGLARRRPRGRRPRAAASAPPPCRS